MTKFKPSARLTRCLAKALISKYLGRKWRFTFTSSRNLCGCTIHPLRLIVLSKYIMTHNSLGFMRGTLLHEIAHAVTGQGHTRAWKTKCLELEIKGRVKAENIIS